MGLANTRESTFVRTWLNWLNSIRQSVSRSVSQGVIQGVHSVSRKSLICITKGVLQGVIQSVLQGVYQCVHYAFVKVHEFFLILAPNHGGFLMMGLAIIFAIIILYGKSYEIG